jgi:hypothetical protein
MEIAGLVAVLDFTRVPEDEFHDWYDSEHLPERLNIPGFLSGERWLGIAYPRYSISTYDLTSLEVLYSEPYRAIAAPNSSPRSKQIIGMCGRVMRTQANQILPGDQVAPSDAGGLLLSAANVSSEMESDLRAWLETEHLPLLANVPGLRSARCFRGEGSHGYFTLYHLATPEVSESAAWRQAFDTPWKRTLQQRFRSYLEIYCKKYARKK